MESDGIWDKAYWFEEPKMQIKSIYVYKRRRTFISKIYEHSLWEQK